MKKTLLTFFLTTLLSLSGNLFAQTYQLAGDPVDTNGWDLVSSAQVNGDFIQLTPDIGGQYGAIKLSTPINLKYCDKWKVEFDFRIDGNGTTSFGRGDGFTFWYLNNPPTGFTSGGGLGIPANANGLMVGFDIFNNSTEGQMSKVHVLYGTNNTPAGNPNIEYNNIAGSTFHSPDLNPTQPFVGATYRHVEVNGQTNMSNPDDWDIIIKIDGNTIVSQTFAPSGGAVGMTIGYFGFSAATGGASARHSIKNAKIFIDKVPLLTNTITPFVCVNPATGNGTVDLTTYQNQFVTNPANYTFTYSANGAIITNPNAFQYSGPVTINVVVKDPSATLCDNGDGQIVLNPSPFAADDASLTSCNNNNAGVAVFDLTTAAVSSVPGSTLEFFNTMFDLTNNINPIQNPNAYEAAPGKIFVRVTTPQGCTDIAEVTLNHYPEVIVNNAVLRSCFLQPNPSMATFNLTAAAVSTQTGITKTYYPSQTDAVNMTNAIPNPGNYTAPNGVIYIRVTSAQGCYAIAKVTLEVIPPVYSTILKDKIICIEDTTTLDAGPGFNGYTWSTGATTQSISNVGVGIYTVELKTGDCIAVQQVKVIPAEQPVVTNVDITANTVTVNVIGGTAPYQYSLDNVHWQDSNIFNNISRGDHTVYVKDAYDCDPIIIPIVVPNLINVITPNGDGVNDVIDYSSLAGKQSLVFSIFDRYGAKIHQGDKSNGYKWDGTVGGRKVPTGNYWYSVTWNENNKHSTPYKFSGWIVVKNRD
ncbi:T9SS type B sorting domain-containing protein [Chryseobacterium sp. MYb264]|uniref:T9SS type B sorting domain-containing protein n=1 Tax=Chryseobacterium sp. MYb264 TaxID=2745153 RepID=UPI002E138DC3|nr:T9SS type B sorting domain-containing protein [Chryseobacterium sp. MYb264]